MEWIVDLVNSALIVSLGAWTWIGFRDVGKRLDSHATKIDSANRAATDAKVNSLDAKREARQVKNLVNEQQIVVGGKLPNTPRNKDLVEKLRQAAERVSAKRAHPAGTALPVKAPGVRRSALTGRYRAPSSYTPAADNTMLNAAVFASLAASSSNSYSDSSSSSSSYDSGSSSSSSSYDSGSSSSSDSGSFGGGDSGSF